MPATRHPLEGPTTLSLLHRERIDWHYHDAHQLVYPESGVLRISTESGSWVVPPQRAVWIPAGVAHSHRAHGPTRMLSLVFTVNPLRVGDPAVLAVSPLLRQVVIALAGDELDARQRRNVERVALDQLRIDPARPFALPQPADDRLRAIAALLTDNPADERGLAELGRAVGASDRTLSRLFRAQTGMSFPQWRAQLRLQHALELLATGAAVTAVAAASGYRSCSAFIETFRQAFGHTPGTYQRHLRSGAT